MLVAFFDKKGQTHKEFMSQKTTMIADLYLNILWRLRERICRIQPELWVNNFWLFGQGNAPVHSAFKIHDFFAKNQVNVLDHPPYSPDLAPCDFFLFCKIIFKAWRTFKNLCRRKCLRRAIFQNVEVSFVIIDKIWGYFKYSFLFLRTFCYNLKKRKYIKILMK